MNLKKLERYLRVNLLVPGPRLIKRRIYLAAVLKSLRNTGLNQSVMRCDQEFLCFQSFSWKILHKTQCGYSCTAAVSMSIMWAALELAAGTDIEPEVRNSSAKTESLKNDVNTLTLFGGNYHLALSLCCQSNISLRNYSSIQHNE